MPGITGMNGTKFAGVPLGELEPVEVACCFMSFVTCGIAVGVNTEVVEDD
jgi:hypothetical protein